LCLNSVDAELKSLFSAFYTHEEATTPISGMH